MTNLASHAAMVDRAAATFDHRDRGRPVESWAPLLAALPTADLPPTPVPIVVLAPHPDDETLGCGSILARASRRGHAVTVVIATDGEASHPSSPTHRAREIADARRRESSTAVAILAPTALLVRLGLPDGHLGDHLSAMATAVNRAIGTGPAWVLAPWEFDRHPDHAAAARAVRRLVAGRANVTTAEYPIWAWHWADPAGGDLPVGAMRRTVTDPASGRARRRALAAYASQIRPLSDADGDEPVLGPHFAAHFDRDFDVLIDPMGSAGRPSYFDRLYAAADDPWDLATAWYERRKRALLLATLPRPRYRSIFEPGCAAGDLTVELAGRCDALLAVDTAPRAVELATAATAELPHVTVRQMTVPQQWPRGRFEGIVISEVGYYAADVDYLARRVTSSLRPGGTVVVCHWRPRVLEHPHTADEVHRAFRRQPGLTVIAAYQEDRFLLDVLARGTGSAVADDDAEC